MVYVSKDAKYTGIDHLYDTLEDHKNFVMKWDYSPITETPKTYELGTTDVFKPGYTQAEEQKTFMSELTENQTFITNSRFIPMAGNEIDFNTLNTSGKLYHMRQLDGSKKQVDDVRDRPEATPEFGRKILRCEPYYGRSFVNWLTIKENIMNERFVPFFQSEAIKQFKRFAERSVVYGVNKMDAVTADAETMDMMHCCSGLIDQLEKQKTVYTATMNKGTKNHNPLWKRTACGTVNALDFSGAVEDAVSYLKKVLLQYMIQGGDRSRAKFYLPAEVEAGLLTIQEKRETQRGDSIYFDQGTCYIWGVPCVHSDTLDYPENGHEPHMFLGDLNGFVIGSKQDITTESQWDMFSQGYHAVTKLYWGTLLLEPRKIIGIPIKGLSTLKSIGLEEVTGTSAGQGSTGGSGSGGSP